MSIGVEQVTLVLMLANLIVTYQGEKDLSFKSKYLFEVDGILNRKEWIRMLSSGFLHGGWWHFLINMYCLYTFSPVFDAIGMPVWYFLLIYFGSLIGGNFLSLLVHKNHPSYRALGASGAVSGVVFAYIAINPYGTILLFFIIPIYCWLAGLLFVGYSIYGIKSQSDNIGHEAHLGGAIIGLVLVLLYEPRILEMHPWIILLISIPTAIFLYLIITRPEMLMIPNYWKKEMSKVNTRFTVKKGEGKKKEFKSKEDEINHYLDKGYENLTPLEKKRLEQLSRKTDD